MLEAARAAPVNMLLDLGDVVRGESAEQVEFVDLF